MQTPQPTLRYYAYPVVQIQEAIGSVEDAVRIVIFRSDSLTAYLLFNSWVLVTRLQTLIINHLSNLLELFYITLCR